MRTISFADLLNPQTIFYLSIIEMPRRSKKSARILSKRRSSRRNMCGGWRVLSGAALNDTSMSAPMNASLQQGEEYSVMHEGQHGGGSLTGAPAFQSEMLPASMVTAARTGETLGAFQEIQGMKDQGGGGRLSQYGGEGEMMPEEEEMVEETPMAGGRRRRKSRKSRKSRGRKSRGRRRRRQGGGGSHVSPADVSAPDMLLSGNSARHAEGAMNPEWQLAKNPGAFLPK